MKPPYRILHVIDNLGPGGAQEVICQLIKCGQRRFFQPEVLALRGLGHYWEVLRGWGVPIHSLFPVDLETFNIYGALPAHMFTRMFLFLTQNRFDLVHAHLLWAMMHATPMAALCRVPVRLNHDHALDLARYRTRKHRKLRLLSHRLSHHIIAVSSSLRTFLCQEEKVSDDKITVINNAVDLSRFSPQSSPEAQGRLRQNWDLPADALVVGGVGRLEYQKNFPLFLEVAAEVGARMPQAIFVIAGEGPDRAALEELSQKLGIASRVRLLGFVKEMPELYQSLDLMLLTSHFEGTPLTILEAMATGVPVVASDVDGVGDVLADGQDSILVPPGRRDLFVQGVCQVLQDRSLWRHFSQAGQAKVQQRHSVEVMVRRVEALYLKYLEGERASY
jgi:glycosyltransferase involved in cell wall biosynthesis